MTDNERADIMNKLLALCNSVERFRLILAELSSNLDDLTKAFEEFSRRHGETSRLPN